MMLKRSLKDKVISSLSLFPATALLGARQVGKTTLAKALMENFPDSIYLDLELQQDQAKLEDAEGFLSRHQEKLVILDEIQRAPGIFASLRGLIDARPGPGRFLLLGSASPDLLRQSSESLAGRIEFLELGPFHFGELKDTWPDFERHWLRGGYPAGFLAKTEEDAARWRAAFIASHLERDIPSFGIRVPAATLSRFWRMLAHVHAQTWKASTLASSMGVSANALNHYLDILEDTYMARRLLPFENNLGKRLVRSPKVYIRDSGLLHQLAGIGDIDSLYSHPVAGPSFEGWCLEQVLAILPGGWRPWFYRTQVGAEIDLLLEGPAGKGLVAVEMKLSSAPQPAKGFWQACADLKPSKSFLVAPVKETYKARGGLVVLRPESISELFT